MPRTGTVERHLVDRLIVDGETSLIFGDGGSGKSLLALALAVAVRTGTPLPGGLTPRRSGPVLLLDWESCQEEHEERLGGLLAGLGIPGPVPISYRRMVGALADEAVVLRAEVARLGAVLVIVDNLVPASGPEPEGADATVRTLNAVRMLGTATLVLAHVSKAHADHRGATRPFGSVYCLNLPRCAWELRREEEVGTNRLTVGLYHRKSNRGPLLWPIGLRFEFTEGKISVQPADLTEHEDLRARAGLGYSIPALLRSGAQTIAELAGKLDANEESVKKTLYRLEKVGKTVQVEKPAPGRPAKWGLKA